MSFWLIIIVVFIVFSLLSERAQEIRQEKISEADDEGNIDEAERLENMDDEEIIEEFEDEL